MCGYVDSSFIIYILSFKLQLDASELKLQWDGNVFMSNLFAGIKLILIWLDVKVRVRAKLAWYEVSLDKLNSSWFHLILHWVRLNIVMLEGALY